MKGQVKGCRTKTRTVLMKAANLQTSRLSVQVRKLIPTPCRTLHAGLGPCLTGVDPCLPHGPETWDLDFVGPTLLEAATAVLADQVLERALAFAPCESVPGNFGAHV